METEASKPYIYQPANFMPESYHGIIGRHPDAARWLLNCVYFRRVTRNYSSGEYVNLHSGLLSKVMGDMALVRPIREAMEQTGLIETDHTWATGLKSIGYRIGPALQGRPWSRYYPTGKRMSKRIDAFIKEAREPKGFTLPAHHHLAGWLPKIEVNTDKQANCSDPERADLGRHQLAEIERGVIPCSVCRYGRFHSSFTSLVKEYRACLSYEGKSFFDVDVVNSQPYFLSLVLLEICHHGKNVVSWERAYSNSLMYNTEKLEKSLNSEEVKDGEGETHHMSLVLDLLMEDMPQDMRQFASDTQNGTLYERLMDQTDNQDRQQVKKFLFQVLYGRNNLLQTEMGQAFGAIYPTVAEMVSKLKRRKGHEWVGRELQRRESRIIIGTICERLRIEHPEVCVITVHDSIMTTQDHRATVLDLMEEEFSRLPYSPTFRVKETA